MLRDAAPNALRGHDVCDPLCLRPHPARSVITALAMHVARGASDLSGPH